MRFYDLRKILFFPQVYQSLQNLIRNDNHIIRFIKDFIKVETDMKILDIGCGPANILNFYPKVKYLGFDLSREYIENAKKRFGDRGEFFCAEVNRNNLKDPATFDLVTALNIMHHLNDEEVIELLNLAKDALKIGGRMVTSDGCKVKGDSFISSIILSLDRGKYIRSREAYENLILQVFKNAKFTITNQLTNIPITTIIFECIKE
jgi:SAM-dependent methyltransferase